LTREETQQEVWKYVLAVAFLLALIAVLAY
jgi:hypothetical protein